MKFLAIDTSDARLIAAAVNGEKIAIKRDASPAQTHSVYLMPKIEEALQEAGMGLEDCDFVACTVGPGSFTGIRIGIATAKGLCFARNLPALGVTSFDALAYTETGRKRLALIDAGRGNYYLCGYGEGEEILVPPAFAPFERVQELIDEGFLPIAGEELFAGVTKVDFAMGLVNAAKAKSGEAGKEPLEALYLRKSAAEEGR